jgi:hypothetical protein
MIETYVLIASVGSLALIWLLASKRRRPTGNQKDQNLLRLEEVIKTSQLTNDGFFRSLDLVQKNLESLLARAEAAEQRLRSLMLQPGVEKKEQYTAAALLLGEGQEPQRVAAMLNLPLPQVQIVQELQKMATKEKKATTRKRREAEVGQQEIATQPKPAAPREKNAAHPILLVDVIRNAANGHGSSGFEEVTA